jgi:hypothetical protein
MISWISHFSQNAARMECMEALTYLAQRVFVPVRSATYLRLRHPKDGTEKFGEHASVSKQQQRLYIPMDYGCGCTMISGVEVHPERPARLTILKSM